MNLARGATQLLHPGWETPPPGTATSTKQEAQRQCETQREGQSGQKIEYAVDCLVGHSCMLYLITEFFGQSDYFESAQLRGNSG
jgi:hypothetical protein